MSFTTSFTVDQTPQQVFEAFTDVRRWWPEEIEHTGDEFEYHFDLTRDETESVGTTITFEIGEKDGETEVRFTHHGLVPEPNRQSVLPAEPAR
ncbi:hypothetical protein [Amycolatopsis decaplanina]|uniref:Activator of Hsp90 ATPase 1-like protein n=1 Tax=Amycolatopsis decaplanina DSM 44594 TaxID=1284240 RepID=M2Z631_9PSEU|nr:hypothetical protein [Amycolatopsis decaplanina]EME56089.1 activator of Hsp90 ATPase 1-like protein [Amycolatopsis decaplanina DSM 44594]